MDVFHLSEQGIPMQSNNSVIYGLDFGTSTTKIAKFNRNALEAEILTDKQGNLCVSLTCVEMRGGQLYFGNEVKNAASRLGEFKRKLKCLHEGVYLEMLDSIDNQTHKVPIEVVLTAYFRDLLFKIIKIEGKELINPTCVITVPANAGSPQKHLTRKCAESAGWRVNAVINEPTAAALSTKLNEDGIVIVYDLGGGTFDLSVFYRSGNQFDELYCHGEAQLGGSDFMMDLAKGMGLAPFNNFSEKLDFEGKILRQLHQIEQTGLQYSSGFKTYFLMASKAVYIRNQFIQRAIKHVLGAIATLKTEDIYLNHQLASRIQLVFAGGASLIPGTESEIKKAIVAQYGELMDRIDLHLPNISSECSKTRLINQKCHLAKIALGAATYGAQLLGWTTNPASQLRLPQDIGFVESKMGKLNLCPVLQKSMKIGLWHGSEQSFKGKKTAFLMEGPANQEISFSSQHTRLGEVVLAGTNKFSTEMMLDHRQVLHFRLNGGVDQIFDPQLNEKIRWATLGELVLKYTRRYVTPVWMEKVELNVKVFSIIESKGLRRKVMQILENLVTDKVHGAIKGVAHNWETLKINRDDRLIIERQDDKIKVVEVVSHSDKSYERFLTFASKGFLVGMTFIQMRNIQ